MCEAEQAEGAGKGCEEKGAKEGGERNKPPCQGPHLCDILGEVPVGTEARDAVGSLAGDAVQQPVVRIAAHEQQSPGLQQHLRDNWGGG